MISIDLHSKRFSKSLKSINISTQTICLYWKKIQFHFCHYRCTEIYIDPCMIYSNLKKIWISVSWRFILNFPASTLLHLFEVENYNYIYTIKNCKADIWDEKFHMWSLSTSTFLFLAQAEKSFQQNIINLSVRISGQFTFIPSELFHVRNNRFIILRL